MKKLAAATAICQETFTPYRSQGILGGCVTKALCAVVVLFAGSAAANAQDIASRYYDAIRSADNAGLHKLIASSGANVRDSRETTPLMYAAAVGSLESMKALIDAGADVNARNAFDITALMWCATDEAKVRLLLSKGADPNAKSKQGRTPLLIAAASQGNLPVVRLLMAKGAELSKADANPATTPLTAAAGADDAAMFHYLLDHGASFAGHAGALSLITAAGLGNIDILNTMLAKGVPVNAVSPPPSEPVKKGVVQVGNFTALILAVGNAGPETVKILLDNKAEINAQEARGMTPLMMAIATDHANPAVVQMLLEHGADRTLKCKSGETAMEWARKYNDPAILKLMGGEAAPVRPVALATSGGDVTAAIRKSVNILQTTSDQFFNEGGCASCHSHNLAAMALVAAQTAGLPVDRKLHGTLLQQTRVTWSPQDQTLMLRMDAPGGHNMESYAVMQFAADEAKPSSTTDALVHNIAAQQGIAGNWHNYGVLRPPLQDGDITDTAIAIRALRAYGSAGRSAEYQMRIDRAVKWLLDAKAVTQQDANMQLLGLGWAGRKSAELQPFAERVAARQRSDGGWGQTANLPSDAYATGQALVALKNSGMPATDPVYHRGVEFLIRSQLADGSWRVVSRAARIQPYFQSGFPHDHDQWISASGTAWATTALAYSLPAIPATAVAEK